MKAILFGLILLSAVACKVDGEYEYTGPEACLVLCERQGTKMKTFVMGSLLGPASCACMEDE